MQTHDTAQSHTHTSAQVRAHAQAHARTHTRTHARSAPQCVRAHPDTQNHTHARRPRVNGCVTERASGQRHQRDRDRERESLVQRLITNFGHGRRALPARARTRALSHTQRASMCVEHERKSRAHALAFACDSQVPVLAVGVWVRLPSASARLAMALFGNLHAHTHTYTRVQASVLVTNTHRGLRTCNAHRARPHTCSAPLPHTGAARRGTPDMRARARRGEIGGHGGQAGPRRIYCTRPPPPSAPAGVQRAAPPREAEMHAARAVQQPYGPVP